MFRKISFAVLAVLFLVSGVRASDEITAADLNNAAISDIDNKVLEAGLDVDVEALANKQGENVDQAIEACFSRYGGWGGYCNSYSYNYSCYNPCYSYSYCYTPTYYTYRPVCYTTCYTPTYTTCYTPTYSTCYSPCYTLSSWGCY